MTLTTVKASDSQLNNGVVVAIRGSVVDIRFDNELPAIHSILTMGDGQKIVIEVLEQRDAKHIRGIALTPTQGLARGTLVQFSDQPLQTPVGRGILSRMFDVFGNTIDRKGVLTDVKWRSVHGLPPTLVIFSFYSSRLRSVWNDGTNEVSTWLSNDHGHRVSRTRRNDSFLLIPFVTLLFG